MVYRNDISIIDKKELHALNKTLFLRWSLISNIIDKKIEFDPNTLLQLKYLLQMRLCILTCNREFSFKITSLKKCKILGYFDD